MLSYRPLCAVALFPVVALCLGCQGLQGVRYHQGPLVADDEVCTECEAAHGELASTAEAGVVEGPLEVAAPHPRFHPVPTRPVFESAEPVGPTPVRHAVVISEDAPALAAAGADDPAPSPEDMPSILANQPNPVRLAKADEVVPPSETELEPVTSSRRKTAEEDETVKSVTAVSTEPIPAEPTKAEAPSSNDMWRPRVGN